MRNQLRKVSTGVAVALLASVMMTGAAFAAPTPPAPATVAGDAIANFGDAAVDVFLGLVSNVWVLALFALGIALAFARRVVGKAGHKASNPIG